MPDAASVVSAAHDPKGKLVSIFVGAVLLPSTALSVVSFHAIPRQAEATQITLTKRAERVLYYVEEDLERTARSRALEAARAIGPERLLEGRQELIQVALVKAGLPENMFDSLRLEGSSPMSRLRAALNVQERDVEALREALNVTDAWPRPAGEESLVLSSESAVAGVLRFRFSCGFVHGRLIQEYFEKEFSNPDGAMVIRVSEPDGDVVYETAPTSDDRFEVKRVMSSPSFQGMKLFLRYRDHSIQEEVRRWMIGKGVIIGFIDLMLGAGLFLVYSNVRREARLARLKSDFVANVSHELKTPLALIRLFAETLELGRVGNPQKAQEYYRVINKESQRLTRLIDNVLDFSRIEAGRKEYRFSRTDVGRIVADVVEAYRFPIEQQGFTLDVSVPEDLPEAEVDREALTQALVNLLNNAIKYSPEDKRIRIEARHAGQRLLISVTDHGIGIVKDEQRKIFDKFFRGGDSLVHETKGSGLGLSLVRHILEAHGGEVLVDSAPGRGSTFTLSIPIERPKA